jgi:hypothetical protein
MDETLFSIDEDFVCIGPAESVIRSCVQIEEGCNPPPECWSSPPRFAAVGGTVLVHDVDMRVPVLKGTWKASKLYNQLGRLAGGMVWHTGEVGAEPKLAAKLIRDMENAGAAVICNSENPEVLGQGVRFIGRYSWNVRSDRFHDPVLDQAKYIHGMFPGPACFFLPPSAIRKTFIPMRTRRS